MTEPTHGETKRALDVALTALALVCGDDADRLLRLAAERVPEADPAPSSSPVGDRVLELAGWLATCAADTLAYIEAGHRISHAEPVGDRCLTDCTEAWYVERDTLRAAIADVRALLAAAGRGEPTDA